jgi:hypothetical protein
VLETFVFENLKHCLISLTLLICRVYGDRVKPSKVCGSQPQFQIILKARVARV